MLLSHNFDVSPDILPVLSLEELAWDATIASKTAKAIFKVEFYMNGLKNNG